jgi:hypothetical protein
MRKLQNTEAELEIGTQIGHDAQKTQTEAQRVRIN